MPIALAAICRLPAPRSRFVDLHDESGAQVPIPRTDRDTAVHHAQKSALHHRLADPEAEHT
jgi:hypothetical protein